MALHPRLTADEVALAPQSSLPPGPQAPADGTNGGAGAVLRAVVADRAGRGGLPGPRLSAAAAPTPPRHHAVHQPRPAGSAGTCPAAPLPTSPARRVAGRAVAAGRGDVRPGGRGEGAPQPGDRDARDRCLAVDAVHRRRTVPARGRAGRRDLVRRSAHPRGEPGPGVLRGHRGGAGVADCRPDTGQAGHRRPQAGRVHRHRRSDLRRAAVDRHVHPGPGWLQ